MYDYTALQQYKEVDIQSKLVASNPHGLVVMLLDGVLQKLAKATGAIEREDISQKGELISASIRIIDSLRASLDFNKGGDLANNLNELYTYMEGRLLKANLDSDSSIIAEVVSLISQIKQAWDAIPNELRGD